MDSFKFSFTVPEEASQFTDVNPSKEELLTFLDGIVTEVDTTTVKPYANIAELKTEIKLIKDGESYPGLPEIKCVPIKIVFPKGSVYQLALGDKETIEFIKNMDGLETDESVPGFAIAVVLEVSENDFIGSFEPMSTSAIQILGNAAPFDVELTLYKSSGDAKKEPEAYPSIERSLDKIVDKMEGNTEVFKEAVPSIERSLYKIAELYEESSGKEEDESGDDPSEPLTLLIRDSGSGGYVGNHTFEEIKSAFNRYKPINGYLFKQRSIISDGSAQVYYEQLNMLYLKPVFRTTDMTIESFTLTFKTSDGSTSVANVTCDSSGFHKPSA